MKNTLLFLSILSLHSFGQNPVRIWEVIHSGNLTGKDAARSIITDSSANVFVTGTSYHLSSFGNFTTIKYDQFGNEVWKDHYYSSQGNAVNGGNSLAIDASGYVYACGTLAITDGDVALMKYGSSGRLWTRTFNPYFGSSYEDRGYDLGIDHDGNIYCVGMVTSISGNMEDVYLVKCDSSGNKIWDMDYSSASGSDYPDAIAVSQNGNTYLTSSSYNFFGSATYDLLTMNHDSSGNQLWLSNYNGSGNSDDVPCDIVIDNTDNTYVCGVADGGATNDFVAYKQNTYGTRLWTVNYNGSANANDTAVAVNYLPNGLVVVTGRSKEMNGVGVYDAITTLLIDSGTVLWTQKYFGSAGNGAIPTSMTVDQNGIIYIAGLQNSVGAGTEGLVLMYDASGNLLWNDVYSGASGLNDRFNSICLDFLGNILVTGQTFSSSVNADYVTVKYGQPGVVGLPTVIKGKHKMNIFPNPVRVSETINILSNFESDATLTVNEITGREIVSSKVSGGNIRLNLKLKPGVYTIQISDGSDLNISNKLVVTE